MQSREKPGTLPFLVPTLLMFLCGTTLLTGFFLLSQSVTFPGRGNRYEVPKVPVATISYTADSSSVSQLGLVEASALLDTAPLFVPMEETLANDRWWGNPGKLVLDPSFPDFPAEIQLDGAHFALLSKGAIPVGQAVEKGMAKLRKTNIGFAALGQTAPPPASLLPPRSCGLSIINLDTGKSWHHSVPPFEDIDTLNPLWEPMVLYAAVGVSGLVTPPSPVNTTGIETLDKRLIEVIKETLLNQYFPIGNYRITISP
jgi:hypothetical protein